MAFLPRVQLLNGSPVFEEERMDAERALIRHYMDKEQKPPRYKRVIELQIVLLKYIAILQPHTEVAVNYFRNTTKC